MRETLLKISKLRKSFGGTSALDGVDLEIAPGEIHGLIGANGAGKSTLMKILSGALPSDSGNILFKGLPYQPLDPRHASSLGVGMIYQEVMLVPHLSVLENLFLGFEKKRGAFLDQKAMIKKAQTTLASLDHGELSLNVSLNTLSLSLQQVVAIARALIQGCDLLILDEPTSSLGKADSLRLRDLLIVLKQQGKTILYITHFLEELEVLVDRVTLLKDGIIEGTYKAGDLSTHTMADRLAGSSLKTSWEKKTKATGKVLLKVPLKRDRFLCLKENQVLGLYGLVGSGRTELLQKIFKSHDWQKGVAYLSENRIKEGLLQDRSVAENILLPSLLLEKIFWISPATLAKTAQAWQEPLQINFLSVQQKTGILSGGNQQKVALARLLQAKCPVWLLDEPTRGVDVGIKQKIYYLLEKAAAGLLDGQPKAILMVSSEAEELLRVADQVAVMRRGEMGEFLDAASLSEQALHRMAWA